MTQFNTLVEEMKKKATELLDRNLAPTGVVMTGGDFLNAEKAIHELITTTATRVREETIEEVKSAFKEEYGEDFDFTKEGVRAGKVFHKLSTLNK